MAKEICSQCGESIYWFISPTGQWKPINVDPIPFVNFEVAYECYVVNKLGQLKNAFDLRNPPNMVLLPHKCGIYKERKMDKNIDKLHISNTTLFD